MKKTLLFLIFSWAAVVLSAQTTTTWDIDNLTTIGGFSVTKTGNPQVKEIQGRNAIEFNPTLTDKDYYDMSPRQQGDRIQVKGNPLGMTPTSFTIEMIFMPYMTNTNLQPRVFHIAGSPTSNKTLTLETRYKDNGNTWYGDFFIRDVNNSGQMNASLTHAVNQWQHIAMTYDAGKLKGYINGVEQVSISGNNFNGFDGTPEVSLGARMQDRYYFKGAIAKVFFTNAVLLTNQFHYDGVASGVYNPEMEGYTFGIAGNEVLFTIPTGENVQIEVYNVMGAKLKTLVSGNQISGDHSVPAEKEDLTAGIYLYKIQTSGGFVNTQKVIVK